ncbi:uncharacterized acetyltransferase At3g50280 [Ricinus communis]|uniref:Anthranilate N-benzoyltransferase protein, putative n=1 Tax=Ricinus communis TaxID=3988 RepID=B9T4T6_RICCO|nr:uncharacterized acetyltransferase At3g50280 [Ricinus communis]EEF29117.1 Anthranilate N-benzoyltransferase protein, putative [Ricinus communis]|eukprot:XP_002533255.1 uncharacterized acetyltransferase At3g50280 [Ricinus communis]
MAGILSFSTTIVQATANQESIQRIELTSSDLKLLLVGAIQKGLLFPKPKSWHDRNLLQHLRTSLSRTLDFFFPLAGRLATLQNDDDTTCFFISCNNAGAQFVHAVAENVTISDVLEPIYVPPIVHSFFPLNGIKNHEGVSQPLVAIQVTELVDGIFIGCTMNHTVADGTTFWNFINCWSQIARGSDHVPRTPVIEHWFRSERYCPVRLPISIIKTDDEFTPPPLQERVFHFSKEKITGLKARANAEAGIDKISSLQSLLAHLWRGVIRNRKLDPNQEPNFHLQIGIRSRLQPKIPEEYFGNAIQVGTVNLKAGELVEHGVGYAALQINKMIACYTEDNVRNNLEFSIKSPKLVTMNTLTRNALITSSSPRFNVYGNDFGWGRPIAVRSGPANKFDGKVTIFPGAEEGSIDIEVCILPQVLQAIGNDSEFMDAITVGN